MRFRANTFGDLLAWAVLIFLIAAAFVVAWLLGFVGLIVLGLLTAVVCRRVEADETNPFVWFRADFDPASKAAAIYGQQPESSEARAAAEVARRAFISPLRLVRRCGIALAAIGVVGFVCQQWL